MKVSSLRVDFPGAAENAHARWTEWDGRHQNERHVHDGMQGTLLFWLIGPIEHAGWRGEYAVRAHTLRGRIARDRKRAGLSPQHLGVARHKYLFLTVHSRAATERGLRLCKKPCCRVRDQLVRGRVPFSALTIPDARGTGPAGEQS